MIAMVDAGDSWASSSSARLSNFALYLVGLGRCSFQLKILDFYFHSSVFLGLRSEHSLLDEGRNAFSCPLALV